MKQGMTFMDWCVFILVVELVFLILYLVNGTIQIGGCR